MSDERKPWEAEEEPPRRDIFAADLVRDPGPEGLNPTSEEIGGWVTRAIERARAALRKNKGLPPADEPGRGSVAAGRATATVMAAAEGQLVAKSLEGELKEAEILDKFADARLKNAQADKLRQDMAFERLERAVALAEKLGAPVNLVRMTDGSLGVTVGENLVEELPGMESAAGPLPAGQAETAAVGEVAMPQAEAGQAEGEGAP